MVEERYFASRKETFSPSSPQGAKLVGVVEGLGTERGDKNLSSAQIGPETLCVPQANTRQMLSCFEPSLLDEERKIVEVEVKGIKVSLELRSCDVSLSWAWLMKEAVRLYNIERGSVSLTTTTSRYLKWDARVSGLLHRKLGFKGRDTEGSILDEIFALSNQQAKNFALVVNGHFALLPDFLLVTIGEFLNSSAIEMCALRVVSSTWKRVFSQDKFW
jgi:hypothetical protein